MWESFVCFDYSRHGHQTKADQCQYAKDTHVISVTFVYWDEACTTTCCTGDGIGRGSTTKTNVLLGSFNLFDYVRS